MSKIKNSAVLITGGAKRLGQMMAVDLAQNGYDIALHYYQSKVEAVHTQKKILSLGRRCELIAANLAEPKEVSVLMDQAKASFPRLQVLINSASIFIPNEFSDQDLSLFQAHWDINFRAPYILSCAFKRLIKKGQIINFIDTNVSKHESQHQDYLLTKKALAEFTQMAAVAWGPDIRVNGISPGMILPPVNKQPDDRAKRAKGIPLKRIGHPQYILNALSYVMSNEYVTGQILAIDGGEGLV